MARLKILEVAGNVCGLKGPAIKAEGLSFIPGMHMVEKTTSVLQPPYVCLVVACMLPTHSK